MSRAKTSYPISFARSAAWAEKYVKVRRLNSGKWTVLLTVHGRTFRVSAKLGTGDEHSAAAEAEAQARFLAWALDRILDAEAPRRLLGDEKPRFHAGVVVAFVASLLTLALGGAGVFCLLRFLFR